MEEPQTIKPEKVNYFAREEDVNIETQTFHSMEIKLEPIKIEPHSPEPNNLAQKCNLTKKAIIIEKNDKCMFNCS